MCRDLRGQRGSPPALHLCPQFAFCSQAAWNFLSALGFQQRGSWGSRCSFNLRLEVEDHCLSFQMWLLPHPLLLFLGSSADSYTFSRCLDVRSGAWSSRPPSSVSTLFYPVFRGLSSVCLAHCLPRRLHSSCQTPYLRF